MITNTFYNLHNYIQGYKILHAVTHKWEYIDIMNSSNFTKSEVERMKSCKYRVETGNAGMR